METRKKLSDVKSTAMQWKFDLEEWEKEANLTKTLGEWVQTGVCFLVFLRLLRGGAEPHRLTHALAAGVRVGAIEGRSGCVRVQSSKLSDPAASFSIFADAASAAVSLMYIIRPQPER